MSDLLAWEENLGIKPEADQSAFSDDPAILRANAADHPGSRAGYTAP